MGILFFGKYKYSLRVARTIRRGGRTLYKEYIFRLPNKISYCRHTIKYWTNVRTHISAGFILFILF